MHHVAYHSPTKKWIELTDFEERCVAAGGAIPCICLEDMSSAPTKIQSVGLTLSFSVDVRCVAYYHEDHLECKKRALRLGRVPLDTVRTMAPAITEKMQCRWCGAKRDKVLKCGACRFERYCDADCQLKDWKRHKTWCVDVNAGCI